ncbi:HAD family hydrolase [Pygmaiobacter massiliensis]|uniref:HAD family hydrolase n=1 Tax=Pygmaiobacter massiliensis TaxID=1917873 RepID=UPI002A81ED05|nr:HAD family hydrolase [Pygmaiobacter massiliensis]MDY4785801.1 HAD family hydrolase [Pygmaiobacter massiliensis]
MIQSLNELLVISDIDNTLLSVPEAIPACNREMIRLFNRLGGHFTVATGRTVASVRPFLKEIELSAPAILYGGGMLYDFNKDIPVDVTFIDKISAKAALRDLLAAFPRVGAEIMTDSGRLYVVNPNEQTVRHTHEESLDYVVCDLDDVPGEWHKVLLADSAAALAPVQQFAQEHSYENLYFLPTNSVYFELMPKGATKGTALKRLSSWTGIALENIYAVGDYYNDIELLRTAGHGIAIGNAVAEVKLVCERTVLPCTDGGVAELLYSLIKQFSK